MVSVRYWIERYWLKLSLAVVLSSLLSITGAGAADATAPAVGTLQEVAALPINPGNIAVSRDNRIFVTVHQFRHGPARLIEVLPPNQFKPWPDTPWNAAPGSGPDVFNAVLGVRIDQQDRLWVIDNGQGTPHRPPKLLAFELATGKLYFRHDFPATVAAPGSFLNDLAVDGERGFVYLADIGGQFDPGIVVVDVNRNQSWRFAGHRSLAAEEADVVVDGRVIQLPGPDGKPRPARVAINPITLSADGETLFYGAMSGRSWWALPARMLRERNDNALLAAAIRKVGFKPVSDGASTDKEGNHFFTNLGENAIDRLSASGELKTLVKDSRLSWPDALGFGGNGWLYIATNQLHRSPPLNGGQESGQPPFRIFRVWTGTTGIAGR